MFGKVRKAILLGNHLGLGFYLRIRLVRIRVIVELRHILVCGDEALNMVAFALICFFPAQWPRQDQTGREPKALRTTPRENPGAWTLRILDGRSMLTTQ